MAQNAFLLLNYVQYARFSGACQQTFSNSVVVNEQYRAMPTHHLHGKPRLDTYLHVKKISQRHVKLVHIISKYLFVIHLPLAN
jgi:hypothetical protein